MPSKSEATRLVQKAFWEEKLKQRLSVLAEEGAPKEAMGKDAMVEALRAKVRETNRRLTTIRTLQQKAQDLARAKAEKAARPKAEKKKKVEEVQQAESKRQQKKQKKKEAKATP